MPWYGVCDETLAKIRLNLMEFLIFIFFYIFTFAAFEQFWMEICYFANQLQNFCEQSFECLIICNELFECHRIKSNAIQQIAERCTQMFIAIWILIHLFTIVFGPWNARIKHKFCSTIRSSRLYNIRDHCLAAVQETICSEYFN